MESLSDENEQVIQITSIQLLIPFQENAVKYLEPLLNSQKFIIRLAVTRALGEIWNFPQLLDLGSNDPFKRLQGAIELGKLKEQRTVYPIISALNDNDPAVRKEAIKALRLINDPRCIKSLIVRLTDKNVKVQKEASIAIRNFGLLAIEPLSFTLKQKNFGNLKEVTNILGAIGNQKALKPLLALLGVEDFGLRMQAVSSLARLGENALQPLIDLLNDKNADWGTRGDAAMALGQIKNNQAVPTLLVALGDDNNYIRRIAVESLGKIGNKRAFWRLIITLEDEDWMVREAVPNALGNLGKEVIELLIFTLNNKSCLVRMGVIQALGKIGDVRALEPLQKILNDESELLEVRALAKQSLLIISS